MADYTNSRAPSGDQVIMGGAGSAWDRLEPLISAETVRALYLFGVPMVGATPDPITKKLFHLTDALIEEKIIDAVAGLELDLHMAIMPVLIKERKDFDKHEYMSYGYFKLERRPVASVELLQIAGADGTVFFTVPQNWIEVGLLRFGQINIIPLTPGIANSAYGQINGGSPYGMLFMNMLAQAGGVPAYWTVCYTAGFKDGLLPRVVNKLIGIETALQILSMLGATYQRSSASLSIDAMSQSVSGPGPQLFAGRIKDLQDERAKMVRKLKAWSGQSLFSGNV